MAAAVERACDARRALAARGAAGLATTIAIAMGPGPKPNDDHSSASDRATSASAGGHRRVAMDASRYVAPTLAAGLGLVAEALGALVVHERQREES
jgi:hypothetical protein